MKEGYEIIPPGAYTVLSVRDSGSGISEEDLPRLRITSYNVCYTKLLRIQEERIDLDIVAGHGGKSQSQRHADDKAFTAGEVFGGTDLSALVVIYYMQLKWLQWITHQQITVAHLGEAGVGVADHDLEGQPLGEVPELFAIV